MNQLVALVASKTGISEDKAATAVTTVLSFLKDRLPAPVAGQVENLLAQNSFETGENREGEGGLLQSLGKKVGL